MKPGIYPGLPEAEYESIEAVRSSTLRDFASATPAHWLYHSTEAPKPDADHQIEGKARVAPKETAL